MRETAAAAALPAATMLLYIPAVYAAMEQEMAEQIDAAVAKGGAEE